MIFIKLFDTGTVEDVYPEGHAVTKARMLLKEVPQQKTQPKVPFNRIERRLYKPVDSTGLLRQTDSSKIVRLNMTSRRLVDPTEFDLPNCVKISSVPWGYNTADDD